MGDWKTSANKRRDFRQTHNGPDKLIRAKKKNTKKWCKGKAGVAHTIERCPHPNMKWLRSTTCDMCTTCGKIIQVYYKQTPLRRFQ